MSELILEQTAPTIERHGRKFNLTTIGELPTRAFIRFQTGIAESEDDGRLAGALKSTGLGVAGGYMLGKGMQLPVERRESK